jgi:hypothetical protein
MGSVDRKAEHEYHMMFILDILAKTGNTFRKLSYEEYTQNGGKDTEAILEQFNRYIVTEDTIQLYAPDFRK